MGLKLNTLVRSNWLVFTMKEENNPYSFQQFFITRIQLMYEIVSQEEKGKNFQKFITTIGHEFKWVSITT